MDRDLPVDVHSNGAKAYTFEKADNVNVGLPAGDYWFEVKLAGTDTTVLSLGSETDPEAIAGGVDVTATAKRTDQTIGLKVGIKSPQQSSDFRAVAASSRCHSSFASRLMPDA